MLLVTGITGHTGCYFLQELIDNNYKGLIRCIVRETSDTSMLDNCNLNFEKVVGDLTDSLFMEKNMEDIDTVFHIAGIYTSLCVISPAVRNKVRRIIVIHTTGIYSKFKSASDDYKKIELDIEKLISNKNINITILRPTMIYGNLKDLNMSKFIKMLDRFRILPIINHGKSLIQPVNSSDLGKAYYKVLLKDSQLLRKEYILSGERAISMREAFNIISCYLNKKTIYINFSLQMGVLCARLIKVLTIGNIDYIERVQRMGENRSFSHENAKLDFDFCPLSFEEGIKNEVDQYRNRLSK